MTQLSLDNLNDFNITLESIQELGLSELTENEMLSYSLLRDFQDDCYSAVAKKINTTLDEGKRIVIFARTKQEIYGENTEKLSTNERVALEIYNNSKKDSSYFDTIAKAMHIESSSEVEAYILTVRKFILSFTEKFVERDNELFYRCASIAKEKIENWIEEYLDS